MKALYFIAQPENLERFSGLFDEEDILATVFSAETLPSLTAFVLRDKAIAQQDFILLDVGRVEAWSSSHILSAVQNLNRFSSARLIFMGEPCEDVTELFGVLARVHQVEHLITLRPGTDVDAALRECFSDKPPARFPDKLQAIQEMIAQQAVKSVRPLSIPRGLTLRAAVAGTMPRCGTTTQAFAVYHYLRSLGFQPAVWDRLGNLLPLLTRFEEHSSAPDGSVEIHGISFCTSELPQFNAYVVDYGVLTPENTAHFSEAELSVLVGCTKPWELPAFAEALKLLFPYSCGNMAVLASFATERELERLAKHFGARSGIAPYSPDPWKAPEQASVYAELLLPALKELCGAERVPEPEVEP